MIKNHWTIQGFGMLRLYVGENKRLHVWCPQLAVKDVSVIHDHPWDFRSRIISGSVANIRYEEVEGGRPSHVRQQIVCGAGGHAVGSGTPCRLRIVGTEIYHEGETYSQTAKELHESRPRPGTITLIERVPLKDPDHALVYHPIGTEWVPAEPRPATPEEVFFALNEASVGLAELLEEAAQQWF